MTDEVALDTCINCGHRAFWHELGGCVRVGCECDFAPSDIHPEPPDSKEDTDV